MEKPTEPIEPYPHDAFSTTEDPTPGGPMTGGVLDHSMKHGATTVDPQEPTKGFAAAFDTLMSNTHFAPSDTRHISIRGVTFKIDKGGSVQVLDEDNDNQFYREATSDELDILREFTDIIITTSDPQEPYRLDTQRGLARTTAPPRPDEKIIPPLIMGADRRRSEAQNLCRPTQTPDPLMVMYMKGIRAGRDNTLLETTNLPFSLALEYLKAGRTVARKAWPKDCEAGVFLHGNLITGSPALISYPGGLGLPISDILATDWMVLHGPPSADVHK